MTDFEDFLQTPHGKIILDNLFLTAKLIKNCKEQQIRRKLVDLFLTDIAFGDTENA